MSTRCEDCDGRLASPMTRCPSCRVALPRSFPIEYRGCPSPVRAMTPLTAAYVIAEYKCEEFERAGECYVRNGQVIPAPQRIAGCQEFASFMFKLMRYAFKASSLEEHDRAKREASELIGRTMWNSPDLTRIVEDARQALKL